MPFSGVVLRINLIPLYRITCAFQMPILGIHGFYAVANVLLALLVSINEFIEFIFIQIRICKTHSRYYTLQENVLKPEYFINYCNEA